jgi:hypothetical protein
VRERTCTGLALTASYWAEPADADPEPVPNRLDESSGCAAMAAPIAGTVLGSRCPRPTYVDPRRRPPRGRRPRWPLG